VKYFDASTNDGFELYKTVDHRADEAGHKFSHSDTNAFLITIVTQEPTGATPQKKSGM
jgi:hypothetical protein